MEDETRRFADIVSGCSRVAGFTGAGISTESGIPDYRGKGGIWNRFQPVYFEEFLHDPEKRRLYWQRKADMWPAIRDARPNSGHEFFVDLHHEGRLLGVITQNIDGLHEKSGLPRENVVNLHGNTLETACLSCSYRVDSEEVFRSFDVSADAPRCPECGGLLKPDTISFGQQLDVDRLERAGELARTCDCMVVFGSTLLVQPAAGIPQLARRHGAALLIVTLSETPLDEEAELSVRRPIGEFVSGVRRVLKGD
ncbi:MAG: SIR2 family NAD-dependent protein deacylase [Spirochaetota bacterium]